MFPLWGCGGCSVVQLCLTLQPHGLQHARLPCPSASSGVCLSSCPLSRWWNHCEVEAVVYPCLGLCTHTWPPAEASPLLTWPPISWVQPECQALLVTPRACRASLDVSNFHSLGIHGQAARLMPRSWPRLWPGEEVRPTQRVATQLPAHQADHSRWARLV